MPNPLAQIRQEYSQKELSPQDCHADALVQFEAWLNEALQAQVNEPTAMHLATVGADGRPQNRVVLLKGVENGELIFFTNYQSRKGQAIATHPAVAATFFWAELERQVRIEGQVRQIEAERSDEYFASRPYSSRLGAWASPQSQEISSKSKLIVQAALLAARYPLHVPRPPHWGGYAIDPERIEFWQGRPSRLHDRVCFIRDGKHWQRSRLAP